MAFENLTVNPKELFKALSMSERMSAAQSELGKTWLGQLTPSEIAELFPDYFRKNLERATSGGTAMGDGQPGMRPYESLIPGNRGGYSGSGYSGDGSGSKTGTSGATPGTAMKPAWLKKVYAAAEKEGWKPSSSEARTQSKTNVNVPKYRKDRIAALDSDPKFQEIISRISKNHNVSREDIYSIMQGESDYNPTLKSPGGGYGGLFQMGRNTLWGKQAWGRNYTSDEIRSLSHIEQAKMYEKLLDEHKRRGWSGGSDGLPTIQAAPAAVSREDIHKDADLGKYYKNYGRGGKYWKANPGWRDPKTGIISKDSIARYYYSRNQVNPLEDFTSVQTGDPSQTGRVDVDGVRQIGSQEKRKGVATSEEDLYDVAQTKRSTKFYGFEKSRSNCGRGTGAVVDAIFGSSYTKGGIGGNAGQFAGQNAKTFVPQLYSGPQQATKEYLSDPSQWRIGDVIAGTRKGSAGHIQVWNGKQWVSDFKQKSGILKGYGNLTLHRVKPEAYNNISSKFLGSMDSNGATKAFINSLPPGTVNLGQNPASAEKDFPASVSASDQVKGGIEYPSNYNKFPEDWRKAIDNLPYSEKADALSAIKYLQKQGKTPEELNSMWEESKQELAQAQQTVGEAPDALKTAEELLKLPAPKIVDSMEGIPTANRFSRQNIDPYRVQRDIVKVQTAYGPANLHKESAPAFVAAFQELKDSGFPMKKVGSLNIRKKTNSNDWSEHAYGNAVDLNDSTTLTRDQKRWMKENPGKFHEILGKYGIRNTSKTNHLEYRGAMPKEGGEIIAQRIEAYKALQRGDAEQPVMVTAPPTQVPSDPYAVQTPGDPRQTGAFSGPEGKDRGIPGSVRQVNSSPTTAPAAPAAPEKRTESPSPETSADVKPTVTAAPVAEPPKKSAEEAPKPQKNRRGGAANNRDLTAIPTPNEQKTPPPKAMNAGGEFTANKNESHGIFNKRTGKEEATLNPGEKITVTPSNRIPAEAIRDMDTRRTELAYARANETNQENRANNLEPGNAPDATATARPSAPVPNEKQLPKELDPRYASSNLSSKTFYDAVEQSKRFVASSRSQGNPKRPEHTEWNGNRVVG